MRRVTSTKPLFDFSQIEMMEVDDGDTYDFPQDDEDGDESGNNNLNDDEYMRRMSKRNNNNGRKKKPVLLPAIDKFPKPQLVEMSRTSVGSSSSNVGAHRTNRVSVGTDRTNRGSVGTDQTNHCSIGTHRTNRKSVTICDKTSSKQLPPSEAESCANKSRGGGREAGGKSAAPSSLRGAGDGGIQKGKSLSSAVMSLYFKDYKLKLPRLTPYQVLRYKYSQGHMFCLDMLMEGHHRSFSVLFNLMRRQQRESKVAEGNSCLKLQSLLENDPQKLAKVKKELTEVEKNETKELKMPRKSSFRYKEGCLLNGSDRALLSRYNTLLRLGRYFDKIGDIWLARFFLTESLASAESITTRLLRTNEVISSEMNLALAAAADDVDDDEPPPTLAGLFAVKKPTATSLKSTASAANPSSTVAITHAAPVTAATVNACSRRVAESLLELLRIADADPRFDPTLENLDWVLKTTTRLFIECRGKPWVLHGAAYENEALRRKCIAHLRFGEFYRQPESFDSAEALSHFQSARDCVSKTRDRPLEARVEFALANQLMDMGCWKEAIEPLRSCEATFVCFGRELNAIDVKVSLSHCYRRMDMVARAKETLKMAMGSARNFGYLQGLVDANFEMAIAELMEEDKTALERAEKRMRRAYLLTRHSVRRELGQSLPPNFLDETVDERLEGSASITREIEKIEERKAEMEMALQTVASKSRGGGGGGGGGSGGDGGGSTRLEEQLDADRENEKRKREHVSSESNRQMRVRYGILSGIQVLPALVDATWKPPVEDIRAEVKAMINWKNNGLLALTEPLLDWELSQDDHFSLSSEDGLVGRRVAEGVEPLKIEVVDKPLKIDAVDEEIEEMEDENASLANLVEVLTAE